MRSVLKGKAIALVFILSCAPIQCYEKRKSEQEHYLDRPFRLIDVITAVYVLSMLYSNYDSLFNEPKEESSIGIKNLGALFTCRFLSVPYYYAILIVRMSIVLAESIAVNMLSKFFLIALAG